MIERLTQRAMFLTVGVLCLAGMIDAIRVGTPTTAIVFGVILLLGIVIGRKRASSRPIRVRRDLREWLDDVASLTGESVDEISNTALSSYRAGMSTHHES